MVCNNKSDIYSRPGRKHIIIRGTLGKEFPQLNAEEGRMPRKEGRDNSLIQVSVPFSFFYSYNCMKMYVMKSLDSKHEKPCKFPTMSQIAKL